MLYKGFVLKGQNSAIKIFKIDTFQFLVVQVRHQKLYFLNKNSKANHFSKVISFKKSKFRASTPTKDNRVFTKT